jgi:PAS domain S-box-containing protein
VTRSVSTQPRRFGPTILWWALLAGVGVAGFLLFLTYQVKRGFSETEALRVEVIRSYETRAQLEELLSLHRDLEAGQRGFVLTGDTQFLESYDAANRDIETSLARLLGQWRGDPANLASLEELRRLSLAKRQFAERTVVATRAGSAAAARSQVATGTGLALMDRLRQAIATIDRRERDRLAERTSSAADARARLQGRIVILQIIFIAALVVALALLVRARLGWERTLRRERDLAARQEAIFAAARDGMLVINASGNIESLNPAAAGMFGYAAEKLLGRDVGMLFEVAPDRSLVETFLRRQAARAEARADEVQDFVGQRQDGSLFPVAVSVSPVHLEGGMRFLAIARDVTERMAVNRMKSEFVSTVSHELRTPLTSISGSLGLIAGGAAGALPERAQRLVEIARSNCARLIRLINDILDIEKIESGKVHFDIRPLTLPALLAQAVDANHEFAAGHSVTIEVEPITDGATVLGDEDRVMQVITNLLSNAVKFSPEGSVVRVSARPLDRCYRVSIADEGPGISEEFRARIFTKFAQADASDTRAKGGTGLGLSIAREIVERLGGALSFDSTPGDGATFHVDLPAVPASVDAGRTVEPLGRISDPGVPLVLHVDDDPDMLRIVADAFEGRAQVHSSPSVLEARAAIARYAFDAVILDIAMADGDGLELIRPIRARQRGAAIILFTAQDAEPSRLEGVDLVLVKSRDSLGRLVAEVARLAHAPGEGTS